MASQVMGSETLNRFTETQFYFRIQIKERILRPLSKNITEGCFADATYAR
jgi:hypothetical protein